MNVGVLTFHGSSNPGAFWQAYATCQLLSNFNYTTEIIDYYSPFRHKRSHWIAARRLGAWKRPDFLLITIAHRILSARSRRLLPISSTPFFEASELEKQHYDAIIVGSDVVWESPIDPVYLGKHLQTDRLIAYAVSAGGTVAETTQLPITMQGPNPFDAISYRDQNTLRLLERAGWAERATFVSDPTITLEIPEECRKRPTSKPYLLVYMSSRPAPEMIEAIRKYAQERSLRIIAVFYPQRWVDLYLPCVTARRWMQYLVNAEAVVTNTFHGAFLSRLNKRPLAIVNMSAGTALKSKDLFSVLGIERRVVSEPENIICTIRTDWSEGGDCPDIWRDTNRRFIEKHLGVNGGINV